MKPFVRCNTSDRGCCSISFWAKSPEAQRIAEIALLALSDKCELVSGSLNDMRVGLRMPGWKRQQTSLTAGRISSETCRTGGEAAMNDSDNPMNQAHAAPRCTLRPSGRASGAKALLSKDGSSVVFTVRAVDIHRAGIARRGGKALGRSMPRRSAR